MRDIDRPDAAHPAPHRIHEKRHHFWEHWISGVGYRELLDWCCDKPRTHPIHLNRRRYP